MWDHALEFLYFCMVVIWRNMDTKPFAPQGEFYKNSTTSG